MEIIVKGNSGCKIEIVHEGNELFVYKSTDDPKYIKRLLAQGEKQIRAYSSCHGHIRIPKIEGTTLSDNGASLKMEYVYSKNFIEFFEEAGFEQIKYLDDALKEFIDNEVEQCTMQTVPAKVFQDKFADIRSKAENNPLLIGDAEIANILNRSQDIFDKMGDMTIPVGVCHGDLTLSNVLFCGSHIYLIDFLDSFIETPLQDIVKLRQDSAYHWSELMYARPYDAVRLAIIADRIDGVIDGYFTKRYPWYRENYKKMQLMNILRILPYAKEQNVVDRLKTIINSLLNENE